MTFILSLITGSAGAAVPLAIMIGTFFLEDTTTIIVGMLAADGFIPVPLALLSLYAGIITGDILLYCLGRLASRIPRLSQYVNHEFTAPFRAWLETRFVLTIFSARFIPGARLPTYTSSGFFRSPLTTFILVAIVATSIWTTLLFTVSYWFGSLTSSWMGPIRWGIAGLVLLALFFIGRRNILAYQVTRNELAKTDDKSAS